jgi:hypothetical protein
MVMMDISVHEEWYIVIYQEYLVQFLEKSGEKRFFISELQPKRGGQRAVDRPDWWQADRAGADL